jgi:hypothetical protein
MRGRNKENKNGGVRTERVSIIAPLIKGGRGDFHRTENNSIPGGILVLLMAKVPKTTERK